MRDPVKTLVRFGDLVETYHQTVLDWGDDPALVAKRQEDKVKSVWPWVYVAVDNIIVEAVSDNAPDLLGSSVSYASDFFQTFVRTDSDEEHL